MRVVVLAGGTGGAALADGIRLVAPQHELTVVANTADDDEFWGVLVCPDVDAVVYRLAGVFNHAAGYGIRDDTFHVLEALSKIDEETWFRVGDRDLATHLLRTELLNSGSTLTEATMEISRRLGVRARVLPMTNDTVRTRFTTSIGELSFQEYFVRERLVPELRAVRLAGIDTARTTAEVMSALREADAVIIGPSNPIISIAPILELVRDQLEPERTIAVSPIVAGAALKGPTVEMMRALGRAPDPVEVARMYRPFAARFVLDARDSNLMPAVEGLGYRVLVTDTVMRDGGRMLAATVLGHV